MELLIEWEDGEAPPPPGQWWDEDEIDDDVREILKRRRAKMQAAPTEGLGERDSSGGSGVGSAMSSKEGGKGGWFSSGSKSTTWTTRDVTMGTDDLPFAAGGAHNRPKGEWQPGGSAEVDNRPAMNANMPKFIDGDDAGLRQFHPLAEEAKYSEGRLDTAAKMIGKLSAVPNATARGLNHLAHPFPRFK